MRTSSVLLAALVGCAGPQQWYGEPAPNYGVFYVSAECPSGRIYDLGTQRIVGEVPQPSDVLRWLSESAPEPRRQFRGCSLLLSCPRIQGTPPGYEAACAEQAEAIAHELAERWSTADETVSAGDAVYSLRTGMCETYSINGVQSGDCFNFGFARVPLTWRFNSPPRATPP